MKKTKLIQAVWTVTVFSAALACSRAVVDEIPRAGGAVSASGSTSSTPPAPVLDHIEVTPVMQSAPAGAVLSYSVTAVYDDSSLVDVTHLVNWQSSDLTVASIGAVAGQVTALAAGNAMIQASWEGKSAQAFLTVTAATLLSIQVTPNSATIAAGLTQQLSAIGTYSDGSTVDLTATATWNSSDSGLASVSNAPGSQGLVSGVLQGMVTVSATVGAITGNASIATTAAALLSIGCSASLGGVPAGTTDHLTATGAYSDGSVLDLTAHVTWSTSDALVATVSSLPGLAGTLNALLPGNVNVMASIGGVSGSCPYSVSAANLVSIAVYPNNPTVHRLVSIFEQFTAVGTYSDGSTQDLTNSVTWSSSAVGIVFISNAAGSKGLATSLLLGDATITATLGSLSASTVLHGVL